MRANMSVSIGEFNEALYVPGLLLTITCPCAS
jgi:hypothetical protein